MLGNENLATEIADLISRHREGAYWDFKQEWYSKEKSSDMLHDIICMANNLENHDAYIIIGVTDDFELCGVENDPNRRNTQNLTDFLKGKKFAGDFRPAVEIRSITVDGVLLDVICVKDNEYVPYYLTDKCKTELFPYHIYIRVQDSNTPKDKSADLIHVEMLWQKRFHLFDSPLEKIKYFLTQKDNWTVIVSPEIGTIRYYKYAPEYIIKVDDLDGDAIETFMLTQMDRQGAWNTISLCYHQTILYQTVGVWLDGNQFLTVNPVIDKFAYQGNDIYYYYLCRNSTKFKVYEFFIHDENPRDYLANREYSKEVLFFDDVDDFKKFECYRNKNMEKFSDYVKKVKQDNSRKILPKVTTQDERNGYDYQKDYDYRLALKILHRDYCSYFKNQCDVDLFDL